jgi:FkbM family methyltransferase
MDSGAGLSQKRKADHVSIFQAWLTTESIRFRTRALKALLRDQRAEFGVIRRHLRPGDIACDIGANKGSFIYWLSWWVRNGRVIAFEPQPGLARDLLNICRVIKLCNVEVEAKAVYSQSGNQDLFLPNGHQPGASLHRTALEGESFTILSVPVVALDDYFSESDKVTLLKIDVEGAEFGVLKGAERILRQHAPLLVFECENRHLAPGTVQDVFSYLEDLGYEGSFVCRSQVFPISEFDAAVHQRQDGEWFWKNKDYCNNFVFRKPRDA